MIEGSRPRGDDSVAQDGDATDDGVMQNSVVTPHTDANTGDTTAGVHEVSLVPVVTVLQTDGSSFVDAVFTHLFACRPSFIRRLPADLSQLKPSFRRALVHVYAKQATGNGLDRRTRRFLRHLAEDHRSFGVEAPDYVAMGDAIIDAGREIIAPQVTLEEFELFAMATGQIIGLMEEGAAEYSEVPVRWGATVLDLSLIHI